MSQLDLSGPILAAFTENLVWLIPTSAAIASFRAFVPFLRGRAGEARVSRSLKRLFPEVANDVILPDGRSSLTQIDHLALTPKGILVVETKTYRGSIFGKEHEPSWTQVLGRRRHSFQNPLRQNHAHIKAVEALNLGVPVEGLVVFAGNARFPNGMPKGVCPISKLGDELAPLREGTVSPLLRAGWGRVLESRRTNRSAKREHLEHLRERHGGVRTNRAPTVILVASIAWLVGIWFFQGRDIEQPRLLSTISVPQPARSRVSTSKSVSVARPLPMPGRLPSAPTKSSPPRLSANPPPRPAVSSKQVATIEWAGAKEFDDACSLAIASVLIDNTAKNRQVRDRACEKRGGVAHR